MRIRALCVCCGAAVAVACGTDSTGPHHPASNIEFVVGNHQTDTIQAALNQALVIRIGSVPAGQTPAHQVVQFVAVPVDSSNAASSDEAYLASLTSPTPLTFVADSTDASGQASVVIILGTKAGRARIIVRVPTFGYVDTAVFTVAPGHPAALRASPADTAVYAGGTVALHSAAVDRAGNPRTDPVTYTVMSGPATLAGSTLTVTGIGRVLVAGAANGAHDTSYASGVPAGRIAASLDDDSGIVAFNLDGSNYTRLTTTRAGTVRWSPSGTSVAFDQIAGGNGSGSPQLQLLTGSTVTVLDNSAGSFDGWPAYSRDGTWIYYSKDYQLWRVHPDGTGDSHIFGNGGDPVAFPGPSPDGTLVEYVSAEGGTIKVVTLSNSSITDVGVPAQSALWSPTSNVIAYNSGYFGGSIGVVNADGSGQRLLPAATSSGYSFVFDWSPDGHWIIARDNGSGKLILINVTSGVLLPLGYTGHIGSPTWH
jgi:Tol biopolymer transport system component